jgi:hypothetical protein
VTKNDELTGEVMQTPKRLPRLISYTIQGKRYSKEPDKFDLEVLQEIERAKLPASLPVIKLQTMHMTHERARMDYSGITYIHHFFLKRALLVLGTMWEFAQRILNVRLRGMMLFWVEQSIWSMSVMNKYEPIQFGRSDGNASQVGRFMKGVYYVASLHTECSPWYANEGKHARLVKAFSAFNNRQATCIVSTGTTTSIGLPGNSIDYIFTDPPFGENIYYADLNFLVESWHRVTTDAQPEAIIDRFKKKALPEYQRLMQQCFAEYYRVLKPGRWMTVVFSNSKAAVWNAIQVALQQVGFVVAEVTALDKLQGSYRQVTSTTAVKQDLVISAYKPNGGLEGRFKQTGPTADSAWDFVRTHLKQLPVVKITKGDFPELVHIVFCSGRKWKSG